jgi:hypothetical protein
MPGNGNSQLNYQQRKQLQKENVLKRQTSNEQYKLAKQSSQASGQPQYQGQITTTVRQNSLSSSQNEPKLGPHKAMTNNFMAGSRPMSSNQQPGAIVMQNHAAN